MNLGQLNTLLRARYLVDTRGYNQVRGMPFGSDELAAVIAEAALELDGLDEQEAASR